VDTAYIRLLTVAMAVLAGLGVLNSVLMVTRERCTTSACSKRSA